MTLVEVEGNPGEPGDPGPVGPHGAPNEGYNWRFRSGQWYAPGWGHAESAYDFTDFGQYGNTVVVQPFLVPFTTTFQFFGIEVVVGSAGCKICPVIYRDNGAGQPSTLIVQGVNMSMGSSGLIFNGAGGGPDINLELTRGMYWLGSILTLPDGADTPRIRSWYPRGQNWIMQGFVSVTGINGIVGAGSVSGDAAPGSFPIGEGSFVSSDRYIPKVMLKAL